MRLRLDTTACRIDAPGRKLLSPPPRGGGTARLRRAGRRHRRGPGPAPDQRPDRPGRAGPRRRGAPAALDGRHLRPHAHPGAGFAGQRGHRRCRVHRPGDGRRADRPRPAVTQIDSCPRSSPPSTPSWARSCTRSSAPRRRRAADTRVSDHPRAGDRAHPRGPRVAPRTAGHPARRPVLVVVGVGPDSSWRWALEPARREGRDHGRPPMRTGLPDVSPPGTASSPITSCLA